MIYRLSFGHHMLPYVLVSSSIHILSANFVHFLSQSLHGAHLLATICGSRNNAVVVSNGVKRALPFEIAKIYGSDVEQFLFF